MVSWDSYSYLFGPLAALGLLAVLSMLLRWAFARGSSLVQHPPRPGDVDEYGLLVAVASPATFVEAEMLRLRLEGAGVRATLAPTTAGPRVMVFPRDAGVARSLLARDRN